MPLTKDEIIALLDAAHELGISTLEVEGVKATFLAKNETSRRPPATAVSDLKAEDILAPLSVLDEITDEEVTYFATPYYDELQEKKKRHAEKLKEDEMKK